jgi:hypothetical protein
MLSQDSLLSPFDRASYFPFTSSLVASLAGSGLGRKCILSPPEIEGILIILRTPFMSEPSAPSVEHGRTGSFISAWSNFENSVI